MFGEEQLACVFQATPLLGLTIGEAVRAGVQGGPVQLVDTMGDRPPKDPFWTLASQEPRLS